MEYSHPLRELQMQAQPDYPSLSTLVLTVLSNFLYIGNVYILSLTAKDYSRHLAMPESFTGLLTGLNWAGAVVFAFVYSFWSNYQFKTPTLVSAVLAMFGNLVYFLAYDMNAAWLLFIGQLLIGIAGPIVINRRYIADYVSVQARTRWNAFLVAGSILGRAFGPIAAAGLTFSNFSFFGFTANGMNTPALVMVFVWLLYAMAVTSNFKEPEIETRVAREQLKKEEEEEEVASWWPLTVALWALFFPKLVQEAFIVSAPIEGDVALGWEVFYVGMYLAVLSLVTSPVQWLIGYLSHRIEDRQFILFAVATTTVGSLMLIDFGTMSAGQYMLGSLIITLTTNIADPVSTSLTSKVLPKRIARGLFNAGLLATLAGSLGRVVAGVTLAWAGASSRELMENNLFIPITIACVASTAFTAYFYPDMVPFDVGLSPKLKVKNS